MRALMAAEATKMHAEGTLQTKDQLQHLRANGTDTPAADVVSAANGAKGDA